MKIVFRRFDFVFRRTEISSPFALPLFVLDFSFLLPPVPTYRLSPFFPLASATEPMWGGESGEGKVFFWTFPFLYKFAFRSPFEPLLGCFLSFSFSSFQTYVFSFFSFFLCSMLLYSVVDCFLSTPRAGSYGFVRSNAWLSCSLARAPEITFSPSSVGFFLLFMSYFGAPSSRGVKQHAA